MVARSLITTAEENTWPKEGPVVFLGEWCKRYSRRNYWEKLNSETVKYHWDDRTKLKQDFVYLQDIYEELLVELAKKLNKFHQVNHSLRYWRILIGPWLYYFVQIVFDRWYMLRSAIQLHDINYCIVLDSKVNEFLPTDMLHFNRLISSDTWNEVIYGQLLSESFSKNLEIKKKKVDISFLSSNATFFDAERNYLKKLVFKIILKLNSWTVRGSEYFFLSTYLPLFQDFRLQVKLGQFPKFWRSPKYESVEIDMSKRQWSWGENDDSNEFAIILRKLIPLHLPISYFEGYSALIRLSEKNSWPNSPKGIFTSVAYSTDDVFKIWTANKVEFGVPLIIGQHGGHFGTSPFSFQESHPIKISDKFISWGWEDINISKIKPVGNIKEFNSKLSYNKKGIALLVQINMSRYSGYLYAVPISSQILSYFEDQFNFINALPLVLQEKVLVRLPGADKGWNSELRWQDRFPNISIDSRKKTIKSLVKDVRIIISTSNSTTYLESLIWNVPTIIFWDVKHWEVKESVQPYFDLLESVGIFHKTPESAASKIIEVWDDVSVWWESDKVQDARNQFCSQFSANPKQFLSKLKSVLQEV